jgi:hypothetical protein
MSHRTTIALDSRVRDRLRIYGRRGASYQEIIEALLGVVDPTNIPDPLDSLSRPDPKTDEEVAIWRAKSATEKVRMGDRLLKAALRNNPEGVRRELRWRTKN